MSADNLPLQDFELALKLQCEDLEGLKKGRKGKGREGETDDFNLAMQLYEAELASCALVASDRDMCGSIARAVNQDADLISVMLREEEQTALDREFACTLNPEGTTTTAVRRPSVMPDADEQLLAQLEALYVSPQEHPAESSSWAASRPGPRTRGGNSEQLKFECIACGDARNHSDVSRCPCSHQYCRECLESLFTACLSDESLFPPRCCNQPIPLDSCRRYLSPTLAGQFLAKKAEFETPNRTYCHEPTCSGFIPLQFIDGEVATCQRCRKTTCVVCKGSSHQGDCPHDPATQELMRVAAENGWQQCYSCHRVVELEHGCNHMACRCGAQFCYACGERWKTCGCEQWRVDRLLARANVIVDRDADAHRLDIAGMARRVDREMQNLMQNHECEHDSWISRRGRHSCEECHDVLPLFIYECRQCRILACRRCRFNRL